MTQQEKVKRYDEALDRCKEWASGTWGHSVDDTPKDIAEFIFPELAESEDERIREEMIRYFTEMKKGGSAALPYDDCIAYLERQKEQQPVEWEDYKDKVNVPYCSSEPERSENDMRLCNLIAKCIALGKQKGLVNDDDEIACLDILKRKDRSLSKYDKDMLKIIIGELIQEGEDVNVPRMYESEINWLKSFFGLC